MPTTNEPIQQRVDRLEHLLGANNSTPSELPSVFAFSVQVLLT